MDLFAARRLLRQWRILLASQNAKDCDSVVTLPCSACSHSASSTAIGVYCVVALSLVCRGAPAPPLIMATPLIESVALPPGPTDPRTMELIRTVSVAPL